MRIFRSIAVALVGSMFDAGHHVTAWLLHRSEACGGVALTDFVDRGDIRPA